MIVIHVGLKKSGSASVQTFLDENAERLRTLSLEYPSVGRQTKRAHHNFAHEIRGLKKFDPAMGTLSQCAQDWSVSKNRVLVLSSEMFEAAEVHQAVQLKAKLLAPGRSDEFRIYMVVRDLVDLLPSSYAQKVKCGFNSHDFDIFFTQRFGERRVNLFDTAERWGEAFGWKNMRVRSLDATNLVRGDLVDDLLDVCGITVNPDDHHLKKPGIQNVSPGWRVLEAVRAISSGDHGLPHNHPLLKAARRQGIRLGERAFKAGEVRGWNRDRGHYLTREQAQACYETYCHSIDQLNQKLPRKLPIPRNLDERGFSARKLLPDVSHIPRKELDAFYDDLSELLQGPD